MADLSLVEGSMLLVVFVGVTLLACACASTDPLLQPTRTRAYPPSLRAQYAALLTHIPSYPLQWIACLDYDQARDMHLYACYRCAPHFQQEPAVFCVVRVRCPSTQAQHYLIVPPHMRRCVDAVAWTFGLTAAEYAPAVET